MSSEHDQPPKWFDHSPPRGGIGLMAGGFVFAALFFIIDGGDSWYTHWVCPWFLPLGIGLWLKHTWARWTAFGVFVLWAVALIVATIHMGCTVKRLIHACVIASSLVALLEWKVFPEEPGRERAADAEADSP